MSSPIDIVLLEKDGDVYHLSVQIGDKLLEVITNLDMEGDVLVARAMHLNGPGPGQFSPSQLRAAARELALSWGAKAVRIHGAMRTTGASPGRRPRPLTITAQARDGE
jgi:hypothetical protein